MKYIAFIILLLIVCSCTSKHGKKLPYGVSEVYYTENVTKEQAQKLGDYLQKNGFFREEKRVSVQLDKAVDTFLFRMVVNDNFMNDSAYNEIIKTSVTELRQNVFDTKPTLIHMCDNRFNTVKIVRERS